MLLRNYLKIATVSKKNFAMRVDISMPTVINYIRGRTTPNKPTVMRILKASDGFVEAIDFFREDTFENYIQDLRQYVDYFSA